MLPTIAQFAEKHGITAKKKYGQNFILDSSLCDKIVRFSGLHKEDTALEVGPGIGGLTRAILKANPKTLLAIEKDYRCIPLLEELKGYFPNLNIMDDDALNFNFPDSGLMEAVIISNLPYYIGTPLLINWLKNLKYINSITIMLQKEVVDRIVAVPNTKDYGRLSIICQLLCNVEKGFDVSPKAFSPPPKVTSSIVKLTPKQPLLDHQLIEDIEFVTKQAFNARRKMVKAAFKKIIPNCNQVMDKLEIDGNLRAENLPPSIYLALAKTLRAIT